MEKFEFRTSINAPASKVWDTLWNDSTYPQWVAVFAEGSRAQTDWQEGSKVLFVDGKGEGMVSVIAEKRINEFMSFKHLGMVTNGVEDTQSDKVKEWAGAHENYTLTEKDGQTELVVTMDIADEYKDYFVKTWPKALDKLKTLAEKN